MAEVPVLKPPKAETEKFAAKPFFDFPMLRGSLFTMNPFMPVRHFTEDMDRFFGMAPRAFNGGAWNPAIEVKFKEGKMFVTAELPGVRREDLKVHIEKGVLTLEGERHAEKEEKGEGYYHSERSYGTFFRTVALPENAKTDAVTAEMNNGLLEIAIPVPAEKTKRLEVPVKETAKKAA